MSFAYVVNDIESTIADNRELAARHGWQVVCDGRNPMREPSLFPVIDPDQIMLMAKMAYRRDCNQSCPLASSPHPLLAIGERHYCKLCTLAWRKAIENWRKS